MYKSVRNKTTEKNQFQGLKTLTKRDIQGFRLFANLDGVNKI